MTTDLDDIVSTTLGLEPEELTDTLTRGTDGAWDSLSHLRLITALEQQYAMRFTMDEIQSIDTLGKLRQVVSEKLEQS